MNKLLAVSLLFLNAGVSAQAPSFAMMTGGLYGSAVHKTSHAPAETVRELTLKEGRLPPDIAARAAVLLVDPMLATGQSAAAAIDVLLCSGVEEERIVFLNVVASPEGLRLLGARFPRVKVVTAAVDTCLDERLYIVPGLGDFGDRHHGT